LYFCKVQFTTGCGAEKKKDKVRNLEQLYENEKYRIEIIMEGKWKVKNLPGVVYCSMVLL
jgi:hypothetical protein